jgi:hypothetical protein
VVARARGKELLCNDRRPPHRRAARQRQLSRAAAGGQNVVPLKRRKQLGVIPLFRSGR